MTEANNFVSQNPQVDFLGHFVTVKPSIEADYRKLMCVSVP